MSTTTTLSYSYNPTIPTSIPIPSYSSYLHSPSFSPSLPSMHWIPIITTLIRLPYSLSYSHHNSAPTIYLCFATVSKVLQSQPIILFLRITSLIIVIFTLNPYNYWILNSFPFYSHTSPPSILINFILIFYSTLSISTFQLHYPSHFNHFCFSETPN